SDKISFANVAEALKVPDTDIKLFGKPDSRPYRRMGVALAKGTTTQEARTKAAKAASTVQIL
ncbi:MAG: phosphoribosylglycinamide formyltransferase 2, partial [Pleurocapsa sp. MO_192.B19]|nr:phosphoribosylglycinamide formyltransferase 2 [Pleurocapsa sp. MO_192.B19]